MQHPKINSVRLRDQHWYWKTYTGHAHPCTVNDIRAVVKAPRTKVPVWRREQFFGRMTAQHSRPSTARTLMSDQRVFDGVGGGLSLSALNES